MENELIKTIVSQGAWAVLFVWLLIDTRKESKTREERLQSIINKNQEVIGDLAEKFDVVESIETDVKEIKIKLDVKEGI
ncbi:BhlA/UviB family holin-like peptide [Clostridium butyricum]|uniref:BhlA/UviB family holin-like peptide n=1 Tax=Clostridium butyricum TaxID=1492 RepID=UPI0013D8028D|nr:BhlA/UviB family holin-like peptide [Clostridium butyricum]MCQ2017301.1 bacteriocin [Clostridium butyricum]MCQ2023229.1 bacteriocin [Clostridium butyricum]NFB73158.1 bacteriocin [Clostridium butyricum]NFB92664.1 bacteriocin [Clostridium butyricum]UTY53560.1 bacteriocin [Clostridium butyricum]